MLASSSLDLEDFTGDAWEFILIFFAIGWIAAYIQKRRAKRRWQERNKPKQDNE